MTTQETNSIASKVLSLKDSLMTNDIMTKIKDAEKKIGNFQVYYYESISNTIKTHLETLGYSVKMQSERNEMNHIIKW